MSPQTVSVIIPTFNCRSWVGQAIDSALAQTLAPTEIIVIDDGSTDDTGAVLNAYGTRIRRITQPNQGVAAARNSGLRAARGDLVAFLDADDVWHPCKLALQTRIMSKSPDVGLLASRVFPWPAETMPELELPEGLRPVRIGREQLAVRNYLPTSSVLVRRDVVERTGEFDVRLNGPEDHDYWLRTTGVASVALLSLPLVGYRRVSGSLSTRPRTMEAGLRRILHKLDGDDFWRGDRMLRRRAYGYASLSCSQLYGAAGDQISAARKLLESLAWYPLPMRRAEAGVPLGRARRLAVVLLRLAHLMEPDPTC